jgi:hypothetical protein
MTQRDVLGEVGALCGHPDPQAFADAVLTPCAHHGNHFRDDEPCPEPCGLTHWRCCACLFPFSECKILDAQETT